ncbi:MAG: histidine--tRNA ligase [Candidatus Ozemobacteraceae bacterium]
MSSISTTPPAGMRDFGPAELAARRHVEHVIRRVFEAHGFVEIETPAVENLSTLLGKYGEEGDQLLFRLLHRRDKLSRALEGKPTEKDLAEMGLRYDLTVPLARFIANNAAALPRFFKRYQIQPVWRADRPGKGRFREFCQCDVDITGTTSLLAEAEVCNAIAMTLSELGLTNAVIHLNHRLLLRGLIAASGIAPDLEETALVAVDKLDKISEEGVLKELGARGISPESGKKLLDVLRRPEGLTESAELDRLHAALGTNEEAAKAIGELRELLETAAGSFAGPLLRIDASLARGLGYYTGPIFEIRAADLKGSLGGGGRYDNLIGMFSNRSIPAVGFSIGFERLILVLEERKLMPPLVTGPEVLLCRFPEVPAVEALRVANVLRRAGVRVEIFPETPKIGKQLGYAESVKATVAAMLGGDELKAGNVTLKNLAGGEQVTVAIDAAVATVSRWLHPVP